MILVTTHYTGTRMSRSGSRFRFGRERQDDRPFQESEASVSPDLLCAARRAVGIVACATSVVAVNGCHQRSSVGDRASVTPRSFPGVDLVPTRSGGFYVRISSGMVGSGEPLYVIDGNPMAIDPVRGIDWFKPEDIVRISVLKAPNELAVYGPRGANGVILITTRLGTAPRP